MGAEIFTNFCFFIHNFGYRYARKQFKGFKDVDFCLVSEKNLIQKNDQWVGAQGQVKVAKKMQKHPHLWRSPQQTPNQIRRGFEQLFSSSGWRFMAKKGRANILANILARTVVKGLADLTDLF